MKRIITICFLLALSQSPGLCQNPGLDSLRQQLQAAKSDTARINIMNIFGTTYMFHRPDSGIDYANRALSLARKIDFVKGEVDALRILAFSLRESGNHPIALQVNLKCLKICEEHNLLHDKALVLSQIGLTHNSVGDYHEALDLFKESKGIFDSIQAPSFSLMTQARLINTYQLMGQYDSALYYSEIAVNEFETLQEKWPQRRLFLAVGKVHKMKGNYPLAIQYLQKVIPKDTIGVEPFGTYISEAYYHLALIQRDLNNVDSSMHYLKRSLFDALYRGHYPQIINAYRTMANINESQDPVIANKYNKLAIAYKDSLELMGKSVALETFVEFDELERQQELAAAEAEFQNRLRTNIFLGGSFTLIVVALLLYRSNRAKQKSKQRIENAYDQLKSTQSQLIHSEKMASLGELTAGIAHEIQNPLNFVNNFSEVNKELVDELEEGLKKGDDQIVKAILKDIRDNEEKVTHHGKRADQIVKSMLQHSRTSSGEKELTDINKLADEYLRLAYHGFRAKDKSFNANFKADLDDDLPKINIVPQDIGRVILNLVNNAFQAVKEVENPEVTVRTRMKGGKVVISVIDNGPGIPKDIKEKIFQPFFTTKAAGEGTGLGLGLSYDIVTKGHGGVLIVESQSGLGSEFVVQLPVNSTEE